MLIRMPVAVSGQLKESNLHISQFSWLSRPADDEVVKVSPVQGVKLARSTKRE